MATATPVITITTIITTIIIATIVIIMVVFGGLEHYISGDPITWPINATRKS